MQLFRIGALVPFLGQVVEVKNRRVQPDGATYLLYTKGRDHALHQHRYVTFGQIVAAMNELATHCVGDTIELNGVDRVVKARWWNCRRGTVLYRIGLESEEGRSWVVAQPELMQRLAAQLS